MAALRKEIIALTIVLCFSGLFVSQVSSKRTKNKIYIELKTQSACFRTLNATHQVGCTSDTSGNVGTVHYVQSEEDFDWILSEGSHSPYVALLHAVDFTGDNVRRLYKSSRVNGIMVINVLENSTFSPHPPNGFSAVESCPNDRYGLYSNYSDYKDCKKLQWNPSGTGLYFQDIGIPIFALSQAADVDAVLNKDFERYLNYCESQHCPRNGRKYVNALRQFKKKQQYAPIEMGRCFFPFNYRKNNETRSYPVCAAEVKARMDAAVDAITCIRRSKRIALTLSNSQRYCDPLGDKNVIALIKAIPQNVTRKPNSVIMLGARVDSTSMFQNEYQAADTAAAGIVTLLATAEALWKVKDEIQKNDSYKDIMFTFFQGETFDYIGSSRMVYDMNGDVFPQKYSEKDKKMYLRKVNLTHLDQIVELNQIGYRDLGNLWLHTDPLSRPQFETKIKQMIDDIIQLGGQLVQIEETSEHQPLPPASAQQFLKHEGNIPVMVITDHQKEFANKYYNSRFDTPDQINASNYPAGMNASMRYDYVTHQAELITNLSTTLARYLYKASTGKNPTADVEMKLTSSSMTVTHLLYCFLISPNCELFKESVEPDNAKSLRDAKQPFPFYISVDSHTNEVTQLIHSILARFTGENTHLKKDDCKAPEYDKRYSYVWMQGNITGINNGEEQRAGWCIQSVVHLTEAVSPAFVIDDYDMRSGEYSTWTESVWGARAMSVRLFLLPSQQFQLLNLCVGVALLLVSLVVVYFTSSSADVIFQSSDTQLQSQS